MFSQKWTRVVMGLLLLPREQNLTPALFTLLNWNFASYQSLLIRCLRKVYRSLKFIEFGLNPVIFRASFIWTEISFLDRVLLGPSFILTYFDVEPIWIPNVRIFFRMITDFFQNLLQDEDDNNNNSNKINKIYKAFIWP